MRGNLQPTTVYLNEDLIRQIKVLSKASKKPKAAIIRVALAEGLKKIKTKQRSSATTLMDLADLAVKLNIKGPKDLSSNHDNYLWNE